MFQKNLECITQTQAKFNENWDFKSHFDSDWTQNRQQPTERCVCVSQWNIQHIVVLILFDAPLFTTHKITGPISRSMMWIKEEKRLGVATIVLKKRTTKFRFISYKWLLSLNSIVKRLSGAHYMKPLILHGIFCNSTTMKNAFQSEHWAHAVSDHRHFHPCRGTLTLGLRKR